MSTLPQMRSKHLMPFAVALRVYGAPVERVLRSAGLPSTCLHDPESLIPVEASSMFRELVARRTGYIDVAISATQHLNVHDLGDFGLALLQAPTLQKSLERLTKLVPTQTSNVTVYLRRCEKGQLTFCHRGKAEIDTGRWHRALYTLGWMLKIVRLADPGWTPDEIWIDTKASPERSAVIESLGAAPRFENDCTGFVVPNRMLALSPAGIDGPRIDADVPVETLWSTSPSMNYAESLRQLIQAYAGDGWLSIAQASEITDTSVRTMQRRLSSEKTTFSEVVEETRSQMAATMLEQKEAAIADISHQLGYKHPGDFTRAFRRWSGVSPSEFRRYRGKTD